MIAGLPGTGIGGLFYLLASGWMVFREGWARLNNRRDISRSKLVGIQIVLALMITGGMWITGEMVGRLLMLLTERIGLRFLDPHMHNFWKTSILYWTVATLLFLYLLMQGLRLLLKISGYLGARRPAIDAPARATLQGRIVLQPLPILEPVRGTISSDQSEEQSLL
jgi:hypothetical protein